MLKTLIFFLFGCSFYFGQSNGTLVTREATLEGDGTKVTSTSGQGGGVPYDSGGVTYPNISIGTQQLRSDLYVFLNQQDKSFARYKIYDISGNLKKDQIIGATNSYYVDISSLSPGNYLIYVEVVSPHIAITQLFTK